MPGTDAAAVDAPFPAHSDLSAIRVDLAAGDAAAGGLDLAGAPPPDGAAAGVSCGMLFCSLPRGCITADYGARGSCSVCVNAICFRCDGPEDCSAGEVCCETSETEAACIGRGGCIRNAITWFMCHADGDCPNFAPRCCPIANGAPYRRCQPKC